MHAGQLLVSAPGMFDPNFARTIVYVFDHHDGSAGVILNRPSDLLVSEAIPDLPGRLADPPVVFFGGPVRTEHALFLGSRGGSTEAIDQESADWGSYDRIRVFAGYSGWSDGQLDEEIASGGWFVVDGDAADVMTAEPEALWGRVLERQGGGLARYRWYPEDPSLN